LSIATLMTMASIPTQAATGDLVYVAVDPCRIVDTRGKGHIDADTVRNFKASGDAATISAQGGNPAGCLNPKGATKPLAVTAYVIAVPPGPGATSGVLSAYPAGQPVPPVGSGSTVNFDAQEIIGNTTTITLCDPSGACPDGDFAVLARNTNQHVVVDVQGYFYPAAGGSGSCPSDMVSVGSLCVDKYEASLVDTSGVPTTPAACNADGSDCGADAGGVNPAIFAQSVAGVLPAVAPSWFQAAIACANVGKRLPSSAEWQMAAAGTNASNCNTATDQLNNAGALAACVSTAGALDMVGNLWEWTADLTNDAGLGLTSAQTSKAAGFGDSYATVDDPTPGTDSMFAPLAGAIAINDKFGFRCVR
jgi:hypothetical protein